MELPQESAESGFRGLPDTRDDIHTFELRYEIERALAALPVDQRAAIILVDIEAMSVSEAAEVLGVPEGTIKSRCARGRTKLAAALAGLRNPDAVANVTVQTADDSRAAGATDPDHGGAR